MKVRKPVSNPSLSGITVRATPAFACGGNPTMAPSSDVATIATR
jgi:hypothetical protein